MIETMNSLGGPFKELAEEDLRARIRIMLNSLPVNQTRLWVVKPNGENNFIKMARLVSEAWETPFVESEILKENGDLQYQLNPENSSKRFLLESKGGHLSIKPVTK